MIRSNRKGIISFKGDGIVLFFILPVSFLLLVKDKHTEKNIGRILMILSKMKIKFSGINLGGVDYE